MLPEHYKNKGRLNLRFKKLFIKEGGGNTGL